MSLLLFVDKYIHKCMVKETKKWDYLSVRWNPSFAICCRCGYEWIPRVEKIRTCAKCRSPYWDMPNSRKEYKKIQMKAIRIVHNHKYRGQGNVTDEKCVDCGKQANHWEHRNYSRPLMVAPVCAKCNQKRGSSENKKGNSFPPSTLQILRADPKWTNSPKT